MLLTELLDDQSDEIKQQVEDAKNRYNTIIREAIRFETRLRLNRGKDDESLYGHSDSSFSKVSVNILAVVPEEIKEFHIPKQFEIAALLSEYKPDLTALRDSSKKITKFIIDYQEKPELFEYVGGPMMEAGDEAEALLKLLEHYDLVKEILKINMDILGRYTFHKPPSMMAKKDPWGTMNGRISLYWRVIGLTANSMGVGIDALTAVVLAHELAHAYSHLGYDIDGTRWDDEGFMHSEKCMVEGVAQYYTEKVMHRLRYRIPGGYDAYKALLEKQPPDYQTHTEWKDFKGSTSEAFRAALITLRKGEPVSRDAFEWHLGREAEKLRGHRQARLF